MIDQEMVAMPLSLMERLVSALEKLGGAVIEERPSELLTYDDVAALLSSPEKKISRRSVERLQKRNSSILRKVKLGARTVRFRPADVEKLKCHLAGDQNWRRQL